jgi:hypothetical protein
MNLIPQTKTHLAVVGAVLAALAIAIVFALAGNSSKAAADASPAPASPAASVPFIEDNPQLAAAGYDLAGARVLSTSSAGSDLIAVDRDGGAQVCIVATEPTRPRAGGGACATREDFGTDGVFAVLLGDSREVVGYLPDGVAQVTATGADGTSTDVAVENNAIRLPLADANRVSFAVDGKPVTRNLAPAG